MFVFMPLGIFPGERKKKKQCKISYMRGHLLRSMQDSLQVPHYAYLLQHLPASDLTQSISPTNWHFSVEESP